MASKVGQSEVAASLSRSRIITLFVTVCFGYMIWGLLVSLQPPIYPAEAEKKGATPSQYGFVFGITFLTAVLSSPIFARYGNAIGAKVLYNGGAFTQAFCGIAFGLLTFVDDTTWFIVLSYIIRGVNGVADAAAFCSVLSLLLSIFPDKVAQIVAMNQMFFGTGYTIGPAVGSYLYEIGGFLFPFEFFGVIALIIAVALFIVVPNVKSERRGNNISEEGEALIDDQEKHLTFRKILKHPSLYIPFLDNTICFLGNGFMISMMGPHLMNEAGATQTDVGNAFLVFGLFLAINGVVAGYVTDKLPYPTFVSVFGNTVLVLTYMFIGPLPFLPLEPSVLWLTVTMAFMAIGNGCVLVSSYARAQSAARRKGYVQDVETYLLISGTWTTSFYMGQFLGSTSAGFLVEAMGFRNSSLIFWFFYILVWFIDAGELTFNLIRHRSRNHLDYQEIQ